MSGSGNNASNGTTASRESRRLEECQGVHMYAKLAATAAAAGAERSIAHVQNHHCPPCPAALPTSVPPTRHAARLAMVACRLSISTFCDSARMPDLYGRKAERADKSVLSAVWVTTWRLFYILTRQPQIILSSGGVRAVQRVIPSNTGYSCEGVYVYVVGRPLRMLAGDR
jgi:hypothetical protein